MLQRSFQLFLAGLIFLSCSKEEFDPSASFTKIYDSFRSDREFDPIDVVATESGFLVLAGQSNDESDFTGVQVIRLDEDGNYIETWDLSSEYYVPVGNLISIDSVHYFFAMQPVSLQVLLISTTTNLADLQITPVNGLYYPLAAAKTSSNNLLLLSYEPDDQQSVISELTTDGAVVRGVGYSIGPGSDVEAAILNHYTDPERSALPFFCGELSDGMVYFNGIYNYSLSLVFSGFGDSPTGVVQGQNMNGGISATLPVAGNDFAVFGFQFNDNFLQSRVSLNTTGISSSIDLLNSVVSEFRSRTPARITMYTTDGADYVIYGAETENRQVALYFFEATSGVLRGIHKIGYINPYTLSALSVAEDNSLLILGTTYVSGRFERIYLTKMSEREVRGIVE